MRWGYGYCGEEEEKWKGQEVRASVWAVFRLKDGTVAEKIDNLGPEFIWACALDMGEVVT